MKQMKRVLPMLLVLAAIYLLPLGAAANDFPEEPGGDPEVPIDGGLSLLLAAGAGYVVKKGADRRKQMK